MKRKMLWGSATASYQCEGAWDLDEKAESMWDRYLHENGLENGDVASDHYHHYEEDIRMMAEGGQNAYRFSLSWPRIIRDLEGNVNEKGLAFYDTLIDTCHRYHIEPFVTIYHWDLPQYLEDIGGWQNIETAYHFEKYCETVFRHFNGKVRFWSTFNEPKWFIFSGYMSGNYPPCHRNIPEVIRGSYNVMFASALGVRKFREMKTEGEIGLVASYQTIYGLDESTETLNAMRHADNYCNNWQVDTACLGEFPSDMVDKLKEQGYDLSFAKEEELQIIRENTVDFIGINYYSPMYVKPYTEGETLVKTNNQGKNYKGDLRSVVKGWFEVA
ncbi:MAG: glycoside hydrolase family 1 protein, partial [Erysipelotrichaceae bacterium]|nr:glycoside hydrolase family 1 protein [Erysipelotrichaceae bacterium]